MPLHHTLTSILLALAAASAPLAAEAVEDPLRLVEVLGYVVVGFLAGIGLYFWTQRGTARAQDERRHTRRA